jgi:predicted ATP-grasp superfamily ATP-dependent carboligase
VDGGALTQASRERPKELQKESFPHRCAGTDAARESLEPGFARPRRAPGCGLACVIGSMDLVRPLGLAGIDCAVVAEPGRATRYSRFARAVVEWADPWTEPEVLLERLMRFAAAQPHPPALFYEGDWDLLLVSRNREQLREAFRFVVADAQLVEDLVDKDRFLTLADRVGLPVPNSRHLRPSEAEPPDLDLPYPVLVKPVTRQIATWAPIAGRAKALRADTQRELADIWVRLAQGGVDVVVQALIPGPESRLECYQAYIDEAGEVVGEFTGRKIRTYPTTFGFSTAVEVTDVADVAALGREVVGRLGLHGVAKLDFKRDPAGELWLLEVNPRFNLWHHPAALAGVNLPALVYADLMGLPRAPVQRARPGTRWVHRRDVRAARQMGIPLRRWLRWALSAEAKSAVALSDPMPVVHGSLSRLAGAILPGRQRA